MRYTTWTIGARNIYASEPGDPSEFLRVVAAGPDARITAVVDVGDHASFVMACAEIARLDHDNKLPTPLQIASYIGGAAGTLHEIMADGTLRGWNENDDLDLTSDG